MLTTLSDNYLFADNILLVGLGSIGKRHLDILKDIAPLSKVTVWRHKPATYSDSNHQDIHFVYSLQDALTSTPRVALLCNPSSFHIETGLQLAENNIHLFIEKPLSNTLQGVDELVQLCHQRNLALMVGYNLRFCKSLILMRQTYLDGIIGRLLSARMEVGQYLPDWRPTQDYRQGVSAQKVLGGGVLLELSHEFDYLRWICGEVKSVFGQVRKLSELELDVEDYCEMIFELEIGAVANIHLDMVQYSPTRTCKLIGTKGILIWNALTHQVLVWETKKKIWAEIHPAAALDKNETYRAELNHFLQCVQEVKTPSPSGEEGRRVVEIVLAVNQSSQDRRIINL